MRSSWRTVEYDSGWVMRPMPAVKWLLIIHFIIFCLQKVFDLLGSPFFDYLQLTSWGVQHHFYWQFFTYMFLHAGVLHLLFNLLMLYFFGNEVETAIGSRRFLQMYILGGIVGGLLWYGFNFHSPRGIVGASSAVYSVVIAFATLYPNRPITLLLFFILPVTLLAKYWAIVVVALSILFSIDGGSDGIGHLAHLGGIAVGYFFIKALTNDRWRFRIQWPKMKSNSVSKKISKLYSPVKKDEFIQQRIDPILDKIAEHGIQSLTQEERRLLNEAKDRLG